MGSPHEVECGMTLANTEFSLAPLQEARYWSKPTTRQRECGRTFGKAQVVLKSLEPTGKELASCIQYIRYNIIDRSDSSATPPASSVQPFS